MCFFRCEADSNNNIDMEIANQELMKKIFDLEIAAIKSTEQIKSLGKKLVKRTDERDLALKEISRWKRDYKERNNTSVVRPDSLNVSYSMFPDLNPLRMFNRSIVFFFFSISALIDSFLIFTAVTKCGAFILHKIKWL